MSINDVMDIFTAKRDGNVSLAIARVAELVRVGMEYARKYPRKNDDWDIIWAFPTTDDVDTEIVIGDRHTDFQPYVAWHCFHGDRYSWGHYCQTFGGAFDEALEKLRNELHID